MAEEDFFSSLILYCYEADTSRSRSQFFTRACHKIDAMLCKRRKETAKLYNPYRNLYLDKCYGESKTPLGEWMNFSTTEDE